MKRRNDNLGRKPKKLFVLATEGSVSERDYFNFFKQRGANITFVGKKNHSSPCNILTALETYLAQEPLEDYDEAWAIIDRDSWTLDQINALLEWTEKDKRHSVAISDPKFEYWWILHHDHANNIRKSEDCDRRLDSLNLQRKRIDVNKINDDNIKTAIARAKKRYREKSQQDNPDIAFTNVHILVESIMTLLTPSGEYQK